MKCLKCQKETKNLKFCSRSCANSYNNKLHPKREKKKFYCRVCGIEIKHRTRVCEKHNPHIVDWSKITLGAIKKRTKYQSHSRIRSLARNWYLSSNKPQKCSRCPYTKHFEVHHIKPINKFKDSTPITVINHPDNLVAYCPNHHWEHQHEK